MHAKQVQTMNTEKKVVLECIRLHIIMVVIYCHLETESCKVWSFTVITLLTLNIASLLKLQNQIGVGEAY